MLTFFALLLNCTEIFTTCAIILINNFQSISEHSYTVPSADRQKEKIFKLEDKLYEVQKKNDVTRIQIQKTSEICIVSCVIEIKFLKKDFFHSFQKSESLLKLNYY